MTTEILDAVTALAPAVAAIAAAITAYTMNRSFEHSRKPMLKISLDSVGDIRHKHSANLNNDIKLRIKNVSSNFSHKIEIWKYLDYKGQKLKLMPINLVSLFPEQTHSEDILGQVIQRLRELDLIDKDKYPPFPKTDLEFVIIVEGTQEADTGKRYEILERFLVTWFKDSFTAEIKNLGVSSSGEFGLEDIEFLKRIKHQR
jgi:hypothetical protein